MKKLFLICGGLLLLNKLAGQLSDYYRSMIDSELASTL